MNNLKRELHEKFKMSKISKKKNHILSKGIMHISKKKNIYDTKNLCSKYTSNL